MRHFISVSYLFYRFICIENDINSNTRWLQWQQHKLYNLFFCNEKGFEWQPPCQIKPREILWIAQQQFNSKMVNRVAIIHGWKRPRGFTIQANIFCLFVWLNKTRTVKPLRRFHFISQSWRSRRFCFQHENRPENTPAEHSKSSSGRHCPQVDGLVRLSRSANHADLTG